MIGVDVGRIAGLKFRGEHKICLQWLRIWSLMDIGFNYSGRSRYQIGV